MREEGSSAGDSEGAGTALEPLLQALTRCTLGSTLQCPLGSLCMGHHSPVSPLAPPLANTIFARAPSSQPFLTCHHACDGRRGIAALPAGGDVWWVSGQCGPHHLSPWKDTTRSHRLAQRGALYLLPHSSCHAHSLQTHFLPTPFSPAAHRVHFAGSTCYCNSALSLPFRFYLRESTHPQTYLG